MQRNLALEIARLFFTVQVLIKPGLFLKMYIQLMWTQQVRVAETMLVGLLVGHPEEFRLLLQSLLVKPCILTLVPPAIPMADQEQSNRDILNFGDGFTRNQVMGVAL